MCTKKLYGSFGKILLWMYFYLTHAQKLDTLSLHMSKCTRSLKNMLAKAKSGVVVNRDIIDDKYVKWCLGESVMRLLFEKGNFENILRQIFFLLEPKDILNCAR